MPDHEVRLNIVVFSICTLLLVLVYAFFSAFENALSLIDKPSWKTEIKNQKTKLYRLGLYFISHYYEALNATLISQTLSSVGSAAMSTILFTDVAILCGLNNTASFGAGIASGLLTVVLLVFGDSIPKTLAKNQPVNAFKNALFIFAFFYFLFLPFSWLLTKLIHLKRTSDLTEERLKNLVKSMNDDGVIDDEAESLINRTISFTNANVEQAVETNKLNLFKLSINAKYFEVYDAFSQSGYSRIPVVDESDHIVGIALLKLFLIYLDPRNDEKTEKTFQMSDIMEDPLIVCKDEKLDEVLRKMQLQRIHIAIVTKDHTNKTFFGWVTFEDILEEIFGPIHDEDENEVISCEQIDDNLWKVASNIELKHFLQHHMCLNYNLPQHLSIHQFIKEQLRKNKLFKRKQMQWEDDYIIISWNTSLITKKLYFTIKKKDQHEDNVREDSLTTILFKNEGEEDTDVAIDVQEKDLNQKEIPRHLNNDKTTSNFQQFWSGF